MNFYFILVAPQHAENIGAAARAINTMGFDHLRLVKPCDYLGEHARAVAHGSNLILESASVFDSLAQAIQDLDFIVGATARRRGNRQDYFSGEELAHILQAKGDSILNIGLVFGREDRGLLNEEIDKCDALVALTMHAPQPSLNLAQAVMVIAYILSPFVLSSTPQKIDKPQENEFKALKNRIQTIFSQIELDQRPKIVGRLMERMGHLSEEDVHLLHSVCEKLERKIMPKDDVKQV